MPSQPHGGVLVNRVLTGRARAEMEHAAAGFSTLALSEQQIREVENLATGVFSPLEGFMGEREVREVLLNRRLPGGVPWTIPIVLDVSEENAERFREGGQISLTLEGKTLAILHLQEKYAVSREEFALHTFGTQDPTHPGVAGALRMKPVLLGGAVDLLQAPDSPFAPYKLTPRETRVLFETKGWRTVVGFQTRNLPHHGHEALQKTALSFVDGLFINPLVGKKKPGDFKDEVIAETYNALLKNYYLKRWAVMAVLQMHMRYAGPREAIFHAIIRKNFGCTHFIVGRDHAGVGKFYHPYAAQEIFQDFPDLGVVPLFFTAFFYCRRCQGIASEKTCPHGEEDRNNFSGTELRKLIVQGGDVEAFIRPEVAEVIRKYGNPFVA